MNMQFRTKTYKDKDGSQRTGQTIQLMRYSYDPVAKRGRQVMIGSFKVDEPRLPPEVEAILTIQEKEEFAEWKKARDKAVSHEKLAAVLDTLDYVMTRSCMALDVGAGQVKDPERIWALLDGLERSMQRAGHERPPRPRGRPVYSTIYDLDSMAPEEAAAIAGADPDSYKLSESYRAGGQVALPDFKSKS
ncbi:MAG: hypothetical protein PHP05_01050 [Sideroxydans sp.]|nr:hypothetical protein [Sideroxydans sp.]